jgi:cytochrome c biogenesis factor
LNWLVALSLPSYLVAVGASVFKLAKSVGGKSLRSILQKTGPQIVHIGVALVLMSYVVSSNMQTFPSDVTQVEGVSGTIVNVGGSVSVGDFSVRLLSLNSSTSAATSYQTDTATIEILKSGDVQKTGVGLANVYGSSGNGEVDVYIYKTAFEDLYFDFQIINGTAALVQVKTVPFMNTLWIGFALLVVGLSMRTASWKHEAPEGQPKAPIQEQRKPPQ